MALWEMSNKQPAKKPAQQDSTRAIPYKPQETAKNAIYGGDQATSNKQNRVSKRNEGTFSLGDGYNYFKDQNNRKWLTGIEIAELRMIFLVWLFLLIS